MHAKLKKQPIHQASRIVFAMILAILAALPTSGADLSLKIGRSGNEGTTSHSAARVDSRFIRVHPISTDETNLIRGFREWIRKSILPTLGAVGQAPEKKRQSKKKDENGQGS